MSEAVAKFAAMPEEEQFRAVLRGDKPICVVAKKHETSLPYMEVQGEVEYKLYGKKGAYPITEYIYYQRGLGEQAVRVAELIFKKKTKQEHKELGKLLGYSKDEIEGWVRGITEPKEARSAKGADAKSKQYNGETK